MTDKELKRLSRAELIELLIEQIRENDKLREENAFLHEQLDSRLLAIENAGSIAKAALEINGVFEAAERAAIQYLESIKDLVKKHAEASGKTITEAPAETFVADEDTVDACLEENDDAENTD